MMKKLIEDLLGQYWDLAFKEGSTGESQGDKANEVLHSIMTNVIQEKIREKISTVFMEMVPDEMMNELVKKAIEDWIKTELPALIRKEMEVKYNEKLKELLADNSFWQDPQYRGKLPMDALSQIVAQSGPAMMTGIMEMIVISGVTRLRNNNF